MEQKRLYRSRKDRMIAGVCGGIAQYFHVDPTPVRLLFVLAALFNGLGLIVYLALWLVTPENPEESTLTSITTTPTTPAAPPAEEPTEKGPEA